MKPKKRSFQVRNECMFLLLTLEEVGSTEEIPQLIFVPSSCFRRKWIETA
ncbi:hypothetical protein [Leptospira noguchii]|uniref:Uncharacterized protein n=1 Tax=Leptospira noguchii TaxID=28182 RepID=M6VFS6_9LEPT|nr:hypothetical protein [Leptospira noguchii]EMO51974.1 hypothetical protein LEP1GSC172_3451 [Leptospira noguchii]